MAGGQIYRQFTPAGLASLLRLVRPATCYSTLHSTSYLHHRSHSITSSLDTRTTSNTWNLLLSGALLLHWLSLSRLLQNFFGSRWETSDLLLRPQYCYRLIQTFRTPPPFLFNEDRQNSGTPTIKYSILCMTSTKKPPYYSPLYHRATFLSNSWVCTQLVWKWGVSLLYRGKTVWRTCVNRPNLERIFSSWRPQPSLTKHHQTSGLRYGASQNGHSFTKFFQLTGVFVGWGLDFGLTDTTEMYNLHTELNWVTTRKFTFQLSFYLIETFHWENKIYQ